MVLNIVIPMAGAGSRFSRAGYSDPKPLIPIHDVPMIRLVIENLRPLTAHRFIFICQRAHATRYDLVKKLSTWAPGSVVIQLDGVTDGAASTVLKAEEFIDGDDPLMIANSDQYVDIDVDDYLLAMSERNLDGVIMTMTADDPKWSFVGLDEEGLVSSVVEKQVISDEATVGIYNFARGGDFVWAAKAMIAMDARSNGEFYVAPAYNMLIDRGSRVGVVNVGSEARGMYGLGTPDDLSLFAALEVSRRATEALDADS